MSKKSKVLNKKVKVKSKEKTAQKKNSKPVVTKKKNSKPKPAAKKQLARKKSKPVSIKKAVKPLDKKKTGKPSPSPKKQVAKPTKKISAKAVSTVKTSVAKKPAQNVPSKPPAPIKSKESGKVASPKKTEAPVKPILKPSTKPKEEKATQASVFNKAEKKTPDVLAVQNTLPVKNKEEISLSKIVSISSSITNAVKKTDSYSIKPEKEPAGKFEMEFVIHSSAEMLYEFLSTPSGLSEWFCDDLNIRNGIYTFIWDDQLMQARLLKTVELQLVRFQWVDKTDGSYFEFRIQKDDLTNDISLIITDFADTSGDRESAKLLWHSQIEKLRHVIGSIF
jgi:uncharacterized protein YndB with AHSA1/START domain